MERILRTDNSNEQIDEIMKYISENNPDVVTFWETVLRCLSPLTFNSICFVIVASNLD